MKDFLKVVFIVTILLAIVYFFIIGYTDKITRIENGEMTLVNESYRDR